MADALTVVEGDICDAGLVASALESADVVYHLAGQTAVTTSIRDPVADFDVNVRGTINVLEAARARDVPPIVIYASTNKVYGDLEDQRIAEEPTRYVLPDLPFGIAETAVLDFTSPYACSKGAADQYVLTYAKTYGLPAVVLRQSCIYGPRQMGVEDQGWAAWLVFAGAAGVPATIFGDGKQVRDLLYVDDLVEAVPRCGAIDLEDERTRVQHRWGSGVRREHLARLLADPGRTRAESARCHVRAGSTGRPAGVHQRHEARDVRLRLGSEDLAS